MTTQNMANIAPRLVKKSAEFTHHGSGEDREEVQGVGPLPTKFDFDGLR